MTANDIYMFLEQIAPFKYQESYDNSGFLIGDKDAEITGVCLCLDITLDVINEAASKNANLIVSHHPVIFKAVSSIKAQTPVHEMIKNNISAICAHTNFDVAVMSDIMLDLLDFPHGGEVIEATSPDGAGSGKITDLKQDITPEELACKCKESFKCPALRYFDGGKPIRRAGVCSGAGGSVFDLAVSKNCDAFITGEVKHSHWIDAENNGVTLIEAGHYYTERPFCDFLLKRMNENFPSLCIFIAESGRDFCKYI